MYVHDQWPRVSFGSIFFTRLFTFWYTWCTSERFPLPRAGLPEQPGRELTFQRVTLAKIFVCILLSATRLMLPDAETMPPQPKRIHVDVDDSSIEELSFTDLPSPGVDLSDIPLSVSLPCSVCVFVCVCVCV